MKSLPIYSDILRRFRNWLDYHCKGQGSIVFSGFFGRKILRSAKTVRNKTVFLFKLEKRKMISRFFCKCTIKLFQLSRYLKRITVADSSQKERTSALNILLVNGKWDCAGVGISLCRAINKHTSHRVRHLVREESTLRYETDITAENYNLKDIWTILKIIEQADILHFNYVDHTVPFFGIKWPEFMKGKKLIFHDHSGWEPRKVLHGEYVSGRLFNRYDDYDRVIVCAPSDTHVFNNAIWLPNIMQAHDKKYILDHENCSGDELIIGQAAVTPEVKSTSVLTDVVGELKEEGYNVSLDVITGVSHSECLRRKQRHYIEFDNMYQGHHGMTGLEAISMGIPTLSWLKPEVIDAYEKLGEGSTIPFLNVRDKKELRASLERLIKNKKLWEDTSVYGRRWIEKYYSEERLVGMYADLYENL